MKQIYYTQCPIGYGLGASNGFQIKRLSPGYPVSSDFRHLGIRAFVAGTRTLAPPTLRYRRGDDGIAEVAWLTPRSHEYETERGLWGRPGGHFAHGVRLDDGELKKIGNWPAGLFDRPLWVRTDRGPSRGEPPPPLDVSADDLRAPLTFESVAPLAGHDVDQLARLLTAVGIAVREGRTLFVIDVPERLGDRIGLLTFAFPDPWRAAITFSTYHDRPEELPGFRIQGTLAIARPNRLALLSQGIIADLERGSIEPQLEPAAWATMLAGWFCRRDAGDAKAWNELGALAQRAGGGLRAEVLWSAEWLDDVFGTHAMLRNASSELDGPSAWQSLAHLTRWAAASRLGKACARIRGPRWWQPRVVDLAEAREALLAQLALPEAWAAEGQGDAWGTTFAQWIRRCEPAEQRQRIVQVLAEVPEAARASFLRAMLREWSLESVDEVLRWLKGLPDLDPALLLPSEVRGAVDASSTRGDIRPLRDVLARALSARHALAATLDALELEARANPQARTALATTAADCLEAAAESSIADFQRWALRQGDAAVEWLAPFLRRVFANPHARDEWTAVRSRTPNDLQSALARVALEVTAAADLQEAFPWSVEELLLRLPEPERPAERFWPGLYLDRSPSDLRLLDQVYERGDGPRALLDWLKAAHQRGELTPVQFARLKNIHALHRALRTQDPRSLGQVDFSAISPRDRPALLARMIAGLDTASVDAVQMVLGWCRDAWPGAFASENAQLAALADGLIEARALVNTRRIPARWWQTVGAIVSHLQLGSGPARGFEPDGLAAELVGATAGRLGQGPAVWEFRRFVLQQEPGWRTLAGDLRRELEGQGPSGGLGVFHRWDDSLDKGPLTARFFELFLNVADDALMEAITWEKSDDVRNLDLAWWNAAQVPGAVPDLRDRFIRAATIAPVEPLALASVEKWLFPIRRGLAVVDPSDDLAPLDADAARPVITRESNRLSAFGRLRWRCLEALSGFVNAGGILSSARWGHLIDAKEPLRLDVLHEGDRYRFVAWLIAMTDELEVELELVPIVQLAEWLWKMNVRDAARIESGWVLELEGLKEVSAAVQRERVRLLTAVCDRLALIDFRARDGGRKAGSSNSP
jgi:hypothetical protein